MSMSFLDMLNAAAAADTLTKKEFGRIMHDPNATEQDKQRALKEMEQAGGYENLGD